MWNIYYHFYLDEGDILLVESQAKKLLIPSQTLQDWHASPYGATLRFCDEATLLLVRKVWEKYANEASKLRRDKDHRAHFEAAVHDAREKQHLYFKGTSRQDVSRSCTPLAAQLSDKLRFSTLQHWLWGLSGSVALPDADEKKTPLIPNPIFAVPLMTSTGLKYPTDPLLSFHLATAHANLDEESLLRLPDSSDNVLAMARLQFDQGVVALSLHKDYYTIRFTASESFSFCHTLRNNLETGETCAQHYRGKIGFDVLKLAESEYGANGKAPRQFDVIDTSTLSHDVSILNLLVSAGPLLKDAPSSTLYTADIYRLNEPDGFEKLLLGHTTTISILLGLVPAEYWTNAKAVSIVDQILAAWSDEDATPEAKDTVSGFRLSWKHSRHMAGQGPNASLHVDADMLVGLIHWVFAAMSRSPVEPRPATHAELQTLIPKQLPVLHHSPGTLAAFIGRIAERTQVDPSKLYETYVLEILEPDTIKRVGPFIGAFAVELSSLGPELAAACGWRDLAQNAGPVFKGWNSIPQAVAVTIVVPTKEWKVLSPTTSDGKSFPPLTTLIAGHMRVPDRKDPLVQAADLGTVYLDTQISFGTVTTEGSRHHPDFTVHVQEDKAGWMGTSPMIISFRVPAAFVEVGYSEAVTGFTAMLTSLDSDGWDQPLRAGIFRHYEKLVSDEEHVFITKYQPGQTSYMPPKLRNPKTPATAPSETAFTVDFDLSKSVDIVGITGRFNITSDRGKKLLADKAPIEVHQSSPFTIDITIGGKDRPQPLVLPLTFPAPILQAGSSKPRIARKSGYIEIPTLLAHPSTFPPILDDYLLPTVLPHNPPYHPITLNTPHLNIHHLPILSLSDRSRTRFLTTLTSLMFSTRERRLREDTLANPNPTTTSSSSSPSAAGDPALSPSARLNFKESLFTIFMLATGLQGGQTGLFALSHPGRGGIHVLLFVSAVRLDAAHGSVVLDAAVLPMTRALVDSKEVEGFLLVLRELECCTLVVDDGELGVWKRVLPGMVERCRSWVHGSGCEYVAAGRVPVGFGDGERVLCGCGEGKLPEEFVSLPEWETAARFATRVAISPVYASALVEELVAPELARAVADELRGKGGGRKVCRNCGKVEGIEGVTLRRCGRCRVAVYCSAECQKTDWKKHRMECHESEEHGDGEGRLEASVSRFRSACK